MFKFDKQEQKQTFNIIQVQLILWLKIIFFVNNVFGGIDSGLVVCSVSSSQFQHELAERTCTCNVQASKQLLILAVYMLNENGKNIYKSLKNNSYSIQFRRFFNVNPHIKRHIVDKQTQSLLQCLTSLIIACTIYKPNIPKCQFYFHATNCNYWQHLALIKIMMKCSK